MSGELSEPDEQLATRLWHAYTSCTLLPSLAKADQHADLRRAYRVQERVVDLAIAAGQRRVGYKLAMTAGVVQQQFGIDQPTSGVLLESMLARSGTSITIGPTFQGRVEGEIAFRMGSDIDGPVTAEQCMDSIAAAFPAIEVVSCRIRNWEVSAFGFVADNAAARYVVVGDESLDFRNHDLCRIAMLMQVNKQRPVSGRGDACYGSPVSALHWLVNHLLERGQALRRGDLVISGSMGPAVAIAAGDHVSMAIDAGAGLNVRFREPSCAQEGG